MPLIRAIVDLAYGLGLTVIAEGVETEHQLEVLAPPPGATRSRVT